MSKQNNSRISGMRNGCSEKGSIYAEVQNRARWHPRSYCCHGPEEWTFLASAILLARGIKEEAEGRRAKDREGKGRERLGVGGEVGE
jgi:hypothetical protein